MLKLVNIEVFTGATGLKIAQANKLIPTLSCNTFRRMLCIAESKHLKTRVLKDDRVFFHTSVGPHFSQVEERLKREGFPTKFRLLSIKPKE